jgi:hypothetical protein
MSQDSKKRLFGAFPVHISTREVSPFHRRYPSKVTGVILAHNRLQNALIFLAHIRKEKLERAFS